MIRVYNEEDFMLAYHKYKINSRDAFTIEDLQKYEA